MKLDEIKTMEKITSGATGRITGYKVNGTYYQSKALYSKLPGINHRLVRERIAKGWEVIDAFKKPFTLEETNKNQVMDPSLLDSTMPPSSRSKRISHR